MTFDFNNVSSTGSGKASESNLWIDQLDVG